MVLPGQMKKQTLGIDWVGCPENATAYFGMWWREGRVRERETEGITGREREQMRENGGKVRGKVGNLNRARK